MRIPCRKVLVRTWFVGFIGLLSTPLMISTGAAQTSVTVSNVRPAGQGWFLDRDPATDPVFGQAAPGDGGRAAFAEDHLLVGWDGAQKATEYLSAVNFDFFQVGIPEDATITKFSLILVEHETSNPQAKTHNTPNREVGYNQGIKACAMPTFLAGQAAAALVQAPVRDCGSSVAGVRTAQTLTPNATAAEGHNYRWDFDLTAMASALYSARDGISFSLEPKLDTGQVENWILAFHDGTFKVAEVPNPGVLASISYTVPPGKLDDVPRDEGFDETIEINSSDFPSFADTSGLVGELVPDEEQPSPPSVRKRSRVLARAAPGRSASFWDIPPFAWALAIFSLATLGASGWLLQLSPAAGRPPGAASALMKGYGAGRDKE